MSDIERPPPDSVSESNARPHTTSLPGASRALETLVAEAREHLDVRERGAPTAKSDIRAELDWSRLESRLMAEIERDKPPFVRDVEAYRTRSARYLRAGALVLAAAAAVAVFVRRDRDVAATGESATHASESASASALRKTEGSGEVRISGTVATPGSVVRAGDGIEVEGARAVFERPHKVSWLIEEAGPRRREDGAGAPARARVKSAGEPLVLSLEHGAIEAQVVPVPAGEAFAVDIATERGLVRIAVHGTHLRVARAGDRVIVDLTEGVVAIGVPPRAGMTYGTTVTAPAHVELDATDLATLRIDHTPSSVRAAIPLGDHETARLENATPPAEAAALTPPTSAPKASSSHVEGTPAAAKLDPPKAPVPARAAIATAVRDCAALRSRPGNVQITVSSSLVLHVSPGGVVETARFSPPLSPDVQTCAAQVIYKVRLDEPGTVTIPIEFSY